MMDHKNQELKQFIQNFNFAEPEWSYLPDGFPNKISRKELTNSEAKLLDAILLAWYACEAGKKILFKRTFFIISAYIIILTVSALAVKSISEIDLLQVKNVSASTVTEQMIIKLENRSIPNSIPNIAEAVESTMSAVIKKE